MPSVDIAGARDGLRANLETVVGLYVYGYVPGQMQLPAAVVMPASEWVTRDQAMGRGLARLTWDVDVHVQLSTILQAQIELEELAGTVVDGLLSDRTLGGISADLHVPTISGFTQSTLSGGDALTITFSVVVYVKDK